MSPKFRLRINGFHFHLRTLADDTLIGCAGLFGIQWMHQIASLGIAIGDPAYWGKGYGTDGLKLKLLRLTCHSSLTKSYKLNILD
ncbi:GNAT family N-acetyltransferase [Fischerella thermalis]|uniref:GNAT family N-acetyltransferase n=1 Tax=Fischerella thermalis TaxID=372787 RepID=UPI0027E5670F|nr:GNAT family N-acetyltransferase [Fischerella thermalis]